MFEIKKISSYRFKLLFSDDLGESFKREIERDAICLQFHLSDGQILSEEYSPLKSLNSEDSQSAFKYIENHLNSPTFLRKYDASDLDRELTPYPALNWSFYFILLQYMYPSNFNFAPSAYLLTGALLKNTNLLEAHIQKALKLDITTFKVKIDDASSCALALSQLIQKYPSLKLRIDPNLRLSESEFKLFLEKCQSIHSNIEYLEDPPLTQKHFNLAWALDQKTDYLFEDFDFFVIKPCLFKTFKELKSFIDKIHFSDKTWVLSHSFNGIYRDLGLDCLRSALPRNYILPDGINSSFYRIDQRFLC